MNRNKPYAINGSSDYGFYGYDGSHIATNLTNKKCPVCNKGLPYITCSYDDTPGHRDTSYILYCKKCKWKTHETSWLDGLIMYWEKKTIIRGKSIHLPIESPFEYKWKGVGTTDKYRQFQAFVRDTDVFIGNMYMTKSRAKELLQFLNTAMEGE